MIHLIEAEEGVLVMDVGGEKRTLKFGMKCSKLIGQKLNELGDKVTGFDQVTLFLWAGLMSKAIDNKLPSDFSLETAFEWLDDLSKKEVEVIVALGTESTGFIKGYAQILQDSEYRKTLLQKVNPN